VESSVLGSDLRRGFRKELRAMDDAVRLVFTEPGMYNDSQIHADIWRRYFITFTFDGQPAIKVIPVYGSVLSIRASLINACDKHIQG
jgi:hypothetical protein